MSKKQSKKFIGNNISSLMYCVYGAVNWTIIILQSECVINHDSLQILCIQKGIEIGMKHAWVENWNETWGIKHGGMK